MNEDPDDLERGLRSASLRGKLADMTRQRDEAKVSEFNRGYLIACCNLCNLHNHPEMASDVLIEAGISSAEVKAMGLSEYDAKALREIRKSRPRDPIKAVPLAEGDKP